MQRLALASALLTSALAAACASSSEPRPDPRDPSRPEVPLIDVATSSDGTTAATVESSNNPTDWTVGHLLSKLDGSINAWQRLKLDPRSQRDVAQRGTIEDNIRHVASVRMDDLIQELQVGPPRNRQIAATALGFSKHPDALGPLLAALTERNDHVLGNVLLGLSMLQMSETPLDQVCSIVRLHADPWVRANASLVILNTLRAGGEGACALAACRQGLVDPEAAVRTHCAVSLGLLADTESIDSIGNLLYDDAAVVAVAAANALASIGRSSNDHIGVTGRKLANAMGHVRGSIADSIQFELIRLSDKNYGDDVEAWTEWAYRLP